MVRVKKDHTCLGTDLFSVASSFQFSNSFLSHSVFQCIVSFLLPHERASCTQVSYRCNFFPLLPWTAQFASVSIRRWTRMPCCWHEFTSAISAGSWEGCTILTTSLHTSTTVILFPSTLQNKRVGINLAAGRLLCILQSQLPWATFTGCSPDDQNIGGKTSTVADAGAMNWRSLLLNT